MTPKTDEMTLKIKEGNSSMLIVAILIMVFVVGYLIGLTEGRSYWFDEDKAVEIFEERIQNPNDIFRFSDLIFQQNLTIQEAIDKYFLFGYGAETCLRMELRRICLNSEKS